MKARREQVDEELVVIKLFPSNYARDLISVKTDAPSVPTNVDCF